MSGLAQELTAALRSAQDAEDRLNILRGRLSEMRTQSRRRLNEVQAAGGDTIREEYYQGRIDVLTAALKDGL